MAQTRTNVSLHLRPDHSTSEKIAEWDMEDSEIGSIVYNTDTGTLLEYRGSVKGWEPLSVNVRDYLIGWQDFADSNTSEASPLVQSAIGGGEVHITNNNNDTLTDGTTNVNAETTLKGVNDLWNTTTNTFDFGGTGIGLNDIMNFRFHTNISASIIEQDFSIRLDFYDEVQAQGNLKFSLSTHVASESLSAGVFRERLTNINAFIGPSIINGSAKAYLVGTKSFEAEIIGFNLQLLKISR